VAGVATIGPGPLLAAPQGSGVSRLRHMSLHTGTAQFLDHEPPPGTAPGGEHRHLTLEPCQPLTQPEPGRWRYPTHPDLAGLGIKMVIGDLTPMHVQAANDRHQGPPSKAPPHKAYTAHECARAEGGSSHAIYQAHFAVAMPTARR
jgi:hypothetical protein